MSFYLGKDNKYFGPFTESDIEKMRADGSIHSYFWVWNSLNKSWQPMQSPPPPPAESMANEIETIVYSLEKQEYPAIPTPPKVTPPIPSKQSELKAVAIEAICFNHRHLVSGNVVQINDRKCVLEATELNRVKPPFMKNSKVNIMLYNLEGGQSEKVEAKLVSLKKNQGTWRYELNLVQHLNLPQKSN